LLCGTWRYGGLSAGNIVERKIKYGKEKESLCESYSHSSAVGQNQLALQLFALPAYFGQIAKVREKKNSRIEAKPTI
jgi:hypothetical protein